MLQLFPADIQPIRLTDISGLQDSGEEPTAGCDQDDYAGTTRAPLGDAGHARDTCKHTLETRATQSSLGLFFFTSGCKQSHFVCKRSMNLYTRCV